MFELLELKKDGIYDAYVRKSRVDIALEQYKKIDTLQQHEKFIKDRAKQLNINIRNWYKEVESGDSIEARPEIQRMLVEIEKGKIDGIIVVDIDRLARGDTADQGIISRTFKYTNTKIITLYKIYDPNNEEDEDFFEFNLFMARKEYKTINKRQQRGRISSVLNGKYCGSTPPYGYDKIKIKGDKGYTLKPNEKEAKIVKLIFEKRNNGEGLNIICNYLNSLNIPTRKSDVWTTATLTTILTNPVYIGKIRWNYNKMTKTIKNGEIVKKRKKSEDNNIILVEGLHPSIINEDIFFSIQNNKQHVPAVVNNKELKNPLSGLVKCGCCGRNMVRRPYSSSVIKKAENNLNKEKVLTCLRSHKGDYSIRQISELCGYSKYTVDNWFSSKIDNFVVPPADAFFKLKEILKIKTNEFDNDIALYHQKLPSVQIDSIICPKAHCQTVASHLYLVEEEILKITEEHLKNQKTIIEYYNTVQKEDDYNAITILNKKVRELENQLEKAYEFVEQNIYTAEEFTLRSKKIKKQIDLNKKELNKLTLTQNKNIKPMIALAEKIVKEYYNVESIEHKNKMLKSIINRIEYTKLKGGKKHYKDFSLKISFKF